jgi:8-oxo-dGTP pyrophosphatase MutT (NUDIX family)
MPPAARLSLDAAKSDKLFYLVANVIVWRPADGRCLMLQRSLHETVHPGQYCFPGGKLEWADLDINKPTRVNGDVLDYEDAVEKLVAREVREEAGLTVGTDLKYINSVAYIRPDGVPSLLVKFAAPYLAGEVVLEQGSFGNFTWANAAEARALDCIMGMPEEIEKAARLFSTAGK